MLEFLDDNNLTENERVDIRRILFQSSKEKSKCYFPDDIAALNELKNNVDSSIPGTSVSSSARQNFSASSHNQNAPPVAEYVADAYAGSSSAVTISTMATVSTTSPTLASAAVNFLPPNVSFAPNYAGYGYVVPAAQNFAAMPNMVAANSPYLSPVTTAPPGIMPLVGAHPHHHPHCQMPTQYIFRYVINPAAAAHDTRNAPPTVAAGTTASPQQIQYLYAAAPPAAISYLPPPVSADSSGAAAMNLQNSANLQPQADVRRIFPPAANVQLPPPSTNGVSPAPASGISTAEEHFPPQNHADSINDRAATASCNDASPSMATILASTSAEDPASSVIDYTAADSITAENSSATTMVIVDSAAERFAAGGSGKSVASQDDLKIEQYLDINKTISNNASTTTTTNNNNSEAFVNVAQPEFININNNAELQLANPAPTTTISLSSSLLSSATAVTELTATKTADTDLTAKPAFTDFTGTAAAEDSAAEVLNKSRDICCSSTADNVINTSISSTNLLNAETGEQHLVLDSANATAAANSVATSAAALFANANTSAASAAELLSPSKFDHAVLTNGSGTSTVDSTTVNVTAAMTTISSPSFTAVATTISSSPFEDKTNENAHNAATVSSLPSATTGGPATILPASVDTTTPPTASQTNATVTGTGAAAGSASKSWASLFKNTASANNAIVINKFVDDDMCSASNNLIGGGGLLSAAQGGSADGPASPNNAAGAPYASFSHSSPPFTVTMTTVDRDPPAQKLGKILRAYKLEHRGPGFQLRGLRNFGNWCYVNATLQALMACPPFVHLIRQIKLDIRSPSCTPMLDALIRFVNEFFADTRHSRKGDDKTASFEPSYVYSVLSSLREDTSFKGRQEDAEEFLGVVLNHLHEEMAACLNYLNDQSGMQNGDVRGTIANGNDSEWQQVGPGRKLAVTRTSKLAPSPVADIFSGVLRNTFSQQGAKDSVSLESFFTLQLSVQSNDITSLSSALQQMGREIILKKDPTKKSEGEIARRTIFQELPLVLILHLKYFVFADEVVKKHTKQIMYGVDLQIDRQLVPSSNVGTSKNDKLSRTYKLFAVVFHHGENAEGGHYTADIFHGGSWFNMDDAKIEIVDEKHVTSYQPPRVPYLLFYRRCDMFSENRGQQQQYSN